MAKRKRKPADDEVGRLYRSLLHYGHHTDDCGYRTGHDCDCGWEGLRDVARVYASKP